MATNLELMQQTLADLQQIRANYWAGQLIKSEAGVPPPADFSAAAVSIQRMGGLKALDEIIENLILQIAREDIYEIHEQGYSGS